MKPLPVIQDCSGCGACCRITPIPPFQPGEEVVRDVPVALMQPVRDRIAADQQFEMLCCVWFDTELLQCRHYEFRPEACRTFEVASQLCRMARLEAGVDQ